LLTDIGSDCRNCTLVTSRPTQTVRVLTYNILLGGAGREQRIADILRRCNADVIALQEANDRALVRRLASQLGMRVVIGRPSDGGDLNIAGLSRLPILSHRNHRHQSMLRSHLEITVDTGNAPLRIHTVHLAARFGERNKGEARRMRELDSVLDDIRRASDAPHLIVGDLNALSPGDGVEATRFFRRMAELARAKLVVRQADGLMGPRRGQELDEELEQAWLEVGIDPALDVGIPVLPMAVGPIGRLVPDSPRLDRALGGLVERWSLGRLLDLGYIDCYRRWHPRARGYTCATWMPAARIDYILASPDLAPKVVRCEVVGSRAWPDPDAAIGSDHFPVVADIAI